MRTLVSLLVSALPLLVACQRASEVVPARLDVTVLDDTKQALADVSISVNGTAVGKTARDGSSTLHLAPSSAGHVRLAVECPEAYRAASARTLTLTSGQQLKLGFECRPKLRTLAVVVNAPHGEGLPVLADGEPIGRVAKDGTLHAVLRRAPEAELRLMLDTATVPLLHPQNPVEDLLVPDHDDIIVFDQPLAMRIEPKRAMARSARPKVEEHHIPYAIGRH